MVKFCKLFLEDLEPNGREFFWISVLDEMLTTVNYSNYLETFLLGDIMIST